MAREHKISGDLFGETQLAKIYYDELQREKSLERGSDHILADLLEAIIAAIYIDSGLDAARTFVINSLFPILMNKSTMTDKNYKSILLEKVQALGIDSPKYQVLPAEQGEVS